MRIAVLWLHVVAMAVWIGGLAYQSHAVLPLARSTDGLAVLVPALRRARRTTWTAISLVVLTGLYNVTQLGPLEDVMGSGAGLRLAGKFVLVLVMISVAAQRDFVLVSRLARASEGPRVDTIVWLDRAVLALALIVMYLGLSISRGV